ncbi:hypothetical protein L249_7173 [Ophiocordyceps polyrhachis-furcata BCC 54312]|uniref:Uncharacterized protein n=1 Tax=Ophiocordyceps polyrhachis-furcata BCC 54312 TaxID=1330021 RepID=A0A367LB90_9HYPO|nr:hypothetical protein L249_7173 [Ophiocordyceps polyrhachis-furcata BCC 54312]
MLMQGFGREAESDKENRRRHQLGLQWIFCLSLPPGRKLPSSSSFTIPTFGFDDLDGGMMLDEQNCQIEKRKASGGAWIHVDLSECGTAHSLDQVADPPLRVWHEMTGDPLLNQTTKGRCYCPSYSKSINPPNCHGDWLAYSTLTQQMTGPMSRDWPCSAELVGGNFVLMMMMVVLLAS